MQKFSYRLIATFFIFICATIATIVFIRFRVFELIDMNITDLWFSMRGEQQIKEKIMIVGIDDKTLNKYEEPLVLWMPRFSELIDVLAEKGVKVIGIDALISKSFDKFLKDEGETKLARSILSAKRNGTSVVLISDIVRDRKEVYPPPKLFFASERVGFANLTIDGDDHVRRQELLLKDVSGKNHISFAYQLALTSIGENIENISINTSGITFNGTPIPLYSNAMVINFVGPNGSFPAYSFSDVIEAVEEAERSFGSFADAIVIVGPTASLFKDTSLNPFSKRDQLSDMTGPEIHANVLHTILSKEFIKFVSEKSVIILTMVGVIAITIISIWVNSIQGLFFLILTCISMFIGGFIYFQKNMILPVSNSQVSFLLTFILSSSYRFFIDNKEKRFLNRIFGSFVNENVLREILKDPNKAGVFGSKRVITVLFADIRNFTPLSEKEAPDRVVSWLNEYLSAMSEEIIRFGGMLDKFIGDGIMAVFGAPLELEKNGALPAVKAALGMEKRLNELNRRWEAEKKKPIKIGIGLHTGEAIVGNIGSTSKLEYTAIGDTVNLASRIETLTKTVQSEDEAVILISEKTHEFVKDDVNVTFVTETKVKGRLLYIKLYHVHSR